jgi:GDP-L-fucose synthase
MKNYWRGKSVLVTGGTGFIGSFVTEQLLEIGAKVTVTTKSGDLTKINSIKKDVRIVTCDLTNPEEAKKVSKKQEIILNLASKVAGIQFNINHPASMFSDNIIINKNMLDAAVKYNVERFLITSSACVYPRYCKIPTPESEGFLDDPEPTNLGYGWSKRVAELMGKFYASEHKLKVAIARPYNAYGPRDNFDPQTSHVIPGIIKRIFDGENPLVIWGSGKQTRSFLYAEDFAKGLIEITKKYAEADPVNIGSDDEVSIGDLAKMLVKLSGKKTKIKFDITKPDGQPRRKCDTTKAKKKFGYEAKTSLEEGLKKTIAWYKHH